MGKIGWSPLHVGECDAGTDPIRNHARLALLPTVPANGVARLPVRLWDHTVSERLGAESLLLATRIGVNQEINRKKIDLVRKCEDICGSYGFAGCRVRLSDNTATVELIEEDIERFAKGEFRKKISKQFKNLGLRKIFVDLGGRRGVEL